MFDIKENKNQENVELDYPYQLFQDGTLIQNVGAREIEVWNENFSVMENAFEVEAFDDKSKFLADFRLEEFSDSISKICLYGWDYFEDFQLNTTININYVLPAFYVDFVLIPDFAFWKRQFSFAEYQEIFHEILLEKFLDWGFMPSNNKYTEFSEIELTISHKFRGKKISEELDIYKDILGKVHIEAVETLSNNENLNSINTSFQFSENLRIFCEQYLLYFAQFLQDLGINATSNLKEEAGKVLFSVTPTDDVEALDKIREALAIYLNLPASPIAYDDSFAAMRLQQQIENLQHSQRMAVRELQFNEKLLVAQSDTLREKNLTISQQHSVIEQQNKIIEKISSKSIMMDSAENKSELEEIYDGVKVGESETLKKWLGISLNPAKAIKTAVKNTFGKDEQKSVLGLDEES